MTFFYEWTEEAERSCRAEAKKAFQEAGGRRVMQVFVVFISTLHHCGYSIMMMVAK